MSTSIVRSVWGLLCSGSSIDQEVNNLSLFNIIDQISLPQSEFNKLTPETTQINANLPHEIILVWRTVMAQGLNDGISTRLKVDLVNFDGTILATHLMPMQIPAGKRRFRFRIRIGEIVVTKPGDYCYKIYLQQNPESDFTLAEEIPFEVASVTGV